jgi:hypothetical protein
MSTKYQVLSKDTAFVGIAKQKSKYGGAEEVKKILIDSVKV